MSKETIELAKNYDPKKSIFPAYAQRKWDGVPARFIKVHPGKVVAFTRQGEVIQSIPHLLPLADDILPKAGGSCIGELIIPGEDFKNISGVVRRTYSDKNSDQLICKMFDADIFNSPTTQYQDRMIQYKRCWNVHKHPQMEWVDYRFVQNVTDVEEYFTDLDHPDDRVEGVMFHDPLKTFQPGKRCWGMGRWKPQPTIDLEVVSFDEATSEAGEPLGMVGRVNVCLRRKWASVHIPDGWTPCPIYKGVWQKVVGVGPGKLTHYERTNLWQQFAAFKGQVMPNTIYAEIKYMPDPSYDALRQPTVQRLRTDKQEGDILN